MTETSAAQPASRKLSPDFWKFWIGQAISILGSSFTEFALPLIVYKLTGSAVNLALTMAAVMLPYLFFGLIIGAWVDRLDRKRIMIVTNVAFAALVASVPALDAVGHLSVAYIYGAAFVASTLGIFFSSAEFAAVPSLVGKDDLVTANGRLQASYQMAFVLGPLLAGALLAVVPVSRLLLFDAGSYLVAVAALLLVKASFNSAEEEARERGRIRDDVMEGLRYVLGHPVLRNISLMMALVNFFGSTIGAQLVLFSKQQLHAADTQLGIIFAAGALGSVGLSLAAGRLRRGLSFSVVALGALALEGVLVVALSFTTVFWIGVVLWGVSSGMGVLFNINTTSLRQSIVPPQMLGRIVSIAGVLAWSAIPLGTFLGGVAIQRTGNVGLVYGIIGAVTLTIPLAFAFTPLGRAEQYLSKKADEVPVADEPASEQLASLG